MAKSSSADRKSNGAGPALRNEEEGATSTIGDMARDFQVTLRTLRFYEARGLLKPRRVGATRLYSSADRAQLKMILKGRQLGFTLTEIRDMMRAPTSPLGRETGLGLTPIQISAQIDHLERQRSDIEGALAELRAAHQRLASELH